VESVVILLSPRHANDCRQEAFMLPYCALVIALIPAEIHFTPLSGATKFEVVADLPPKLAAKLAAAKIDQEAGQAVLEVRLVQSGKEGPPMLGTYLVRKEQLVFDPRFGLQPEKTYRARLRLPGEKPVELDYTVPARAAAPAPEVVGVWPTAKAVPANMLRFYVQFSRPMRGGSEIFDQIQLVDASGKIVEEPWLRDELWNEDGSLLILYIHPGRIKWGVLLRLLMGPVLHPDRAYNLVIRESMRDADGRRLGKDFVKAFRTAPENRARIDLSKWRLEAPERGTRAALNLAFPAPVDHLGLERYLKVMDGHGDLVPGKIEVAQQGCSWSFVPVVAWADQAYTLKVDERLEDIAGNTPTRPFDVDLEAPVPAPQRLTFSFKPRSQR
jgi:hypothetical protein